MSIDTIKSVDQFTNNLSDYYLNLLKSWISINKYTKIPSNVLYQNRSPQAGKREN